LIYFIIYIKFLNKTNSKTRCLKIKNIIIFLNGGSTKVLLVHLYHIRRKWSTRAKNSQVFSPESREKKQLQTGPRPSSRTYTSTCLCTYVQYISTGTYMLWSLYWNICFSEIKIRLRKCGSTYFCYAGQCRLYTDDICSLLTVSKNDSTAGTYRVRMNSYKIFKLVL